MDPTDQERQDEEIITLLRERLSVSEPLPPGLATRMEAAVAREARKRRSMSRGELAVLVCIVFVIAGLAFPGGVSTIALGVVSCAALAYGLLVRVLVRHLAFREKPPERLQPAGD